jgi:hypothetical protein
LIGTDSHSPRWRQAADYEQHRLSALLTAAFLPFGKQALSRRGTRDGVLPITSGYDGMKVDGPVNGLVLNIDNKAYGFSTLVLADVD